MICRLVSIISIQLYRVLKDRNQLEDLLVTVNPIITIVPCQKGTFQLHVLLVNVNLNNNILWCVEGQDSAACSECYCQSYQCNCTVC